MHRFYFNECLPEGPSVNELSNCLEKVLLEYKQLKDTFPAEVDGICSHTYPGRVKFCGGKYNLEECISKLKRNEIKKYAYSLFCKHPVEDFFEIYNEEELLTNAYELLIDGISHDAINIIIVHQNKGILFSLGYHPALRKNIISISCASESFETHNLFGEKENTEFIEEYIHRCTLEAAGHFEKLLLITAKGRKHPTSFSERFRKGFMTLPPKMQEVVTDHFLSAVTTREKGATPFYPDDLLIKDVTHTGEKIQVYELRIFEPMGCRIYFYETPEKVYLALIEKKPKKKKQSDHINTAHSILKELLLTS